MQGYQLNHFKSIGENDANNITPVVNTKRTIYNPANYNALNAANKEANIVAAIIAASLNNINYKYSNLNLVIFIQT